MKLQLLAVGNDSKTVKGEKFGYMTAILYLAPFNLSGHNVCPFASKGCAAACLYSAGRGAMKNVQDARMRKTKWFFQDRKGFLDALRSDIAIVVKMAKARNMIPTFRFNGTSDVSFHKIIAEHPELQAYDYTASIERVLTNDLPNYSLVFSRKETTTDEEVDRVLAAGHNVAVVFSKPGVTEWRGHKVIDGDLSDLRFLDERGVIVGLKAKGKARQDTSGFVVHV